MLDFFEIRVKEPRSKKSEVYEIYPDFTVGRSKDLMVQGKAFYAIWDEEVGLWSRDEYDVRKLVDRELLKKAEEMKAEGFEVSVKLLKNYSNNMWKQFQSFLKNVSDNSHPLDTKLAFADTKVKRSDYVSRRLSYTLAPGPTPAYDTLMGRLYESEERQKFEWGIGSIIAGDSKRIQNFFVFYGKGGTGKSTVMDLMEILFGGKVKDGGYIAFFDSKALVGNNGSFALEAFRDNPLVAIQHDGDLSKVEDNGRLNSIVSHDEMRINEKYKATYDNKINAMLFMGSNKAVQITDAKSGIIRRLIDIHPTGETFDADEYFELVARMNWEIGAIAHHCLEVYKSMGRSAYNKYEPTRMMMTTDVFLNFIDYNYDVFARQDGTTLKQAWSLYKEYAEEAALGYSLKLHQVRERLKDYFKEYKDRDYIDGAAIRSVYSGFIGKQFKQILPEDKEKMTFSLVLDSTESILDEMYAGLPAQYANAKENPSKYWDDEERNIRGVIKKPRPDQVCTTILGDLDTTKLHYVKIPEHHIVIDFDLKGDDGEKSLERNLEAAASWPATYAEFSKSGKGVHLHYIWDGGDTSDLDNVYSEGIEIKVYRGNSALRRKLTYCNGVSVATLSSGLPFKKEKNVSPLASLQTEQGLRNTMRKAMRKEINGLPGTKPSMDFIEHILKQAYESGVTYDLEDMTHELIVFSNNSQKNSDYCFKVISRLHLKGKPNLENPDETTGMRGTEAPVGDGEEQQYVDLDDERIVFFDCEVYPNLFVICWKHDGDTSVSQMINPDAKRVEQFIKLHKIAGYNNLDYDNHILYAAAMGATVKELYELSQRIIVKKDRNARFAGAYGISYCDVRDIITNKQSLKKHEIDLGIPHIEMDIPWDQPVPDDRVLDVVQYCCNDVNALEAVFHHYHEDFVARQILAELSGLSINTRTAPHAARIIFGNEREPQKKFNYVDLSEVFPGYTFNEFSKNEKSTYCGEVVGEGGYVYAEPGIHENVVLLDIASMHPTSLVQMNYFGPYTEKFSGLLDARLSIKRARIANEKDNDYELETAYFLAAKQEFEGRLVPHIEEIELIQDSKERARATKGLENALKLVINSVYGLTCATFPNKFKDPRNKDNVIAKRGALFMIKLKHFIQDHGFTVAHIKTDSVKIPDANEHIIKAVIEFGKEYGYDFEEEATFEKLFLENDAVYVGKDKKKGWTATGSRFKHPYVFKTMFSKEGIQFRDLGETKQVNKGVMYLRYPDGDIEIDRGERDIHVGRSGCFIPIRPGNGRVEGGKLVCWREDLGKDHTVSGTKGYQWMEEETFRQMFGDTIERMIFEPFGQAEPETGSIEDIIDMSYYNQLCEDAAQAIAKYGTFEEFVK